MSIESTLVRVGAIRQEIADPAALIGRNATPSGGVEAPSTSATTTPATAASASSTSFASALQQATGVPALAYSPGTTTGSRIVAVAEGQLGQAEQPPGSNEGPAIAQYRTATAGAAPGEPWCAYFASWAASQAGTPIGENGQGLGSVSAIWSWAQSSGRAVANAPGVVPKPGDLIVFGDQHVGIVKEVLPSGQIATIEGNYENKVAANVRSPTEATGYVSMG
ncbi:MAG TPA: CHAP domain-containing protein [Solirubrobacteraceae bacterium]|nr:CHAP domain-containing protein [Solirubrobacteraceae bacterium]